MDLQSHIGNPRITDYSFSVSDFIMTKKPSDKKTLTDLYNYQLSLCTGPNALYPESNWQPHRLCLMSSIAVVLNNTQLISQCEKLANDWIQLSNCKCCTIRSRDFHFRSSLEYVVYGWWALARAFLYLQSTTKKSYKGLFTNYLNAMKPYQNGSKIHYEFVRSQYMPQDKSKASYGKKFDPAYHTKTFMTVFVNLK